MIRVIGSLLVLAFTIYSLVDCLQTDEDRVKALPKVVWAFFIALFPIVGAGAWWFAGRPSLPRPPSRPQRRGPVGPDDDPDFLRGL